MSATVELPQSSGLRTSLPVERRLFWLVICVTCLSVSIEVVTRPLHDRRQVTLAMEAGVQKALAIRANDRRQILFVGNSLIYEGLSEAALQKEMGPTFAVHAAGVPGSTFEDWQYGLESLFARGSQPDVIVFGISPSQFLRPAGVTPLPVSQLWTLREVFSYWRRQRVDLSTLSNLVLEHFSAYFYMRNTMRIYARKQIPGYEAMVASWGNASPPPRADPAFTASIFTTKLALLQRACGKSARLVLVIVPTGQAADAANERPLKEAATKLGIRVIDPVHEQEWPMNKFQSDGYHLSSRAAIEFSGLAGAQLKRQFEPSTGTLHE